MKGTFYLHKSDKADKKYFIEFENPKTNRMKKVYFGASGYQDYTMHKDDERKERYINRHKNNERWNDPTTAGFYSRWLLWNKPTLSASIKNTNERFGIQIKNSNKK